MSSLKEIKDRIGSIRGTLKITSAMKLVSSAKLRKAQSVVESMLPYERTLRSILSDLMRSGARPGGREDGGGAVAVVVVASNSSLCGGFNANVVRELRALSQKYGERGVKVFAVGRKALEGAKSLGLECRAYNELSGKPTFEDSCKLAGELVEGFESGLFGRVELLYTHFVNAASQKVTVETFLPFELEQDGSDSGENGTDFIIEPGVQEALDELQPKVIRLRLYSMLLDSAAAEHAARTIAMQTASDNAEDLLSELTLEYNKSRQQKITAEILDIVGGSQS